MIALADMTRAWKRPSNERIAKVLGILPSDLPAVLSGTIELTEAEWFKLSEEFPYHQLIENELTDEACRKAAHLVLGARLLLGDCTSHREARRIYHRSRESASADDGIVVGCATHAK
jgi:hypothetical protein